MKKIIFDDAISYAMGVTMSQFYTRRLTHINFIANDAETTISVEGDEISVSIFVTALPHYLNAFRYKVRNA